MAEINHAPDPRIVEIVNDYRAKVHQLEKESPTRHNPENHTTCTTWRAVAFDKIEALIPTQTQKLTLQDEIKQKIDNNVQDVAPEVLDRAKQILFQLPKAKVKILNGARTEKIRILQAIRLAAEDQIRNLTKD